MATKTILESNGTIDFTKQSDIWLRERLNGVVESIRANEANVNPIDIDTFKNIANEMKRRGIL